MAVPRRLEVLRHSVVDRLVGDDEGPPRGGDLRIGVDDVRRVIRRDLEWLLNSRLVADETLAGYEEASRSILGYGLLDLSGYSTSSGRDNQAICDMITKAVRAFEPRLAKRTVKVEFVPSTDVADSQMHFRISGTIQLDPIVDRVTFDTALDRASGSVTVQETE
jgi:type VI secretion system protein ImpF